MLARVLTCDPVDICVPQSITGTNSEINASAVKVSSVKKSPFQSWMNQNDEWQENENQQ